MIRDRPIFTGGSLEVATGHMTDQLVSRHRHRELLSFLKQVAGACPRRQLHIVCDNYATHKHAHVRAWLVAHPASTCTSPPPTPPG
jgi:hypothetical protein